MTWVEVDGHLVLVQGRSAVAELLVENAAGAVEQVHLVRRILHEARKLLKPEQWIGLSTHSLEQLDAAADQGVDYAGYGPIYPTGTKGYEHGLGPESVLNVLLHARVPVVAIGGISPANAGRIPEQAALAVSSVICAAESPREVAAALRTRGPVDIPHD